MLACADTAVSLGLVGLAGSIVGGVVSITLARIAAARGRDDG